MKRNQSLVLLTRGEQNRQILGSQLNDLLRGKVQVRSLNVDDNFSPSLLEGDLIVVASRVIRKDLKHHLDGLANVLVARRTIDLRSIHQLLRLPPRTKALLINDRKETAEEAISLLYGMGFNDFWLIPAYPGLDNIPQVEVAVTPGEPQLVPKHIKQVINLGCRIIDVTTLTEIMYRLELLDEEAHFLSARYYHQVIEIGKKLLQSSNEKQDLNRLLTTVLNKVHDGVIALDSNGKTLVYNHTAAKIFDIPAKQVIGQRLREMIPQLAADRPLQQLKSEEDSAELYGSHKLLIRRTLLENESREPQGVVVTFSDQGALEKLERRLKTHPGNTGYVAKYSFNDIKGKSQVLLKCLEKARYFAETDLTVLINGPSGTGKELLAHAIHNTSPRSLSPFVAINCTALPNELLESELFGFEEGAFTGARRGGRAGLFEQANSGTIFLDEIGDLPFNLQAKLLRVLEEKEVMRIGAERIIPVDVRIIAATNQDLREAVEHRDFRQDLYYRLNTVTLKLPSLQERPEDIYVLIENFLKKWDRKPEDIFTTPVLNSLLSYSWPGNIRELRNVVDYMAVVCHGRKAGLEDLPPDLQQQKPPEEAKASGDLLKLAGELMGSPKFSADLAILRIIADNRSLGRQRLTTELIRQGFALTEDMVRTRLKALAQRNLLNVGSGRQGTHITEKGREMLFKWLSANGDKPVN
jgi:transcriptional regulator with PAS, ATPase and Fis domain